MEFFQRSKLRKMLQFRFWFNTFFLDETTTVPENRTNNDCGGGGGGEEKTVYLRFAKNDLDIVCKKDKEHKVYKSDFKVSVTLSVILVKKNILNEVRLFVIYP